MKLTFSILWFDDREDYFDSLDLDWLKAQISSWGFAHNIVQVTKAEDFIKHKPFQTFDLIIVDRNLEGYGEGEDFISDLRDNAVYTEVIFYTSGNVTDLWVAIHDKQLEGVFVSHKNEILPKISKVGRQSIRKVLDLENMRGIVMAELGELDYLLDEIITIGIEGLENGQRQSIFTKFHKMIADENERDRNHLEIFRQNPTVTEMLTLTNSYKRWISFSSILKRHKKIKGREIGNFNTDILKPRNSLAHGRAKPIEGGGYIFSHAGEDFVFDDATSLKLRQTILEYKLVFSDILTTLR